MSTIAKQAVSAFGSIAAPFGSLRGAGVMAPARELVQLSRDKRIREYRCLGSAAVFSFEILEQIDLEQLTHGRERARPPFCMPPIRVLHTEPHGSVCPDPLRRLVRR